MNNVGRTVCGGATSVGANYPRPGMDRSPQNVWANVDSGGVRDADDSQLPTPNKHLLIKPHTVLEYHAGVAVCVNRCPFGHGSVGAGPYPGYVHGVHPTICKEGCMPDPQLNKYGHAEETPLQTLLREAIEFQEIYHKDNATPPGAKETRIAEITAEIECTGTYTHTFSKLHHGARVAWRNAPKCSNRKFWQELDDHLVDGRNASTPTEMLQVCLEMLELASASCATTANIACFRPQTPGTSDGPRVWNNQLIRFAGYKLAGSDKVLGDPAELDFITSVMNEFGWKPPGGCPGRFDVLPLILQAHPDEPPQMFELPPQYAVRVPICHPTNRRVSALGLQWYAVPAVSCLELSVGGLTYTASPFNGWYADTEIVRNLTDEGRYNICPEVAACLGLDTRNNATMWRDRAILEVNVAVMHSFEQAGMGMVDHHTLMRNFYSWWCKERQERGYSPGNWKWIIPPISSSASPCYLKLNKMTEYTLKPGYWYAPGWRKYLASWKAQDATKSPAARNDLEVPAAAAAAEQASTTFNSSSKTLVVIIYATVTGNAQQYAEAVAGVLKKSRVVQPLLMNVEDFDSDAWGEHIAAASIVLMLSSTHGPGDPPRSAAKYLDWLGHSDSKAREVFTGKSFAVLGFGSSNYPRFCAAADLLHTTMLTLGGSALLNPHKADALIGEDRVVSSWLKQVVQMMDAQSGLQKSAVKALEQQLPTSGISMPQVWRPKYNLFTLKGPGLQAAEDYNCDWATVTEVQKLLRVGRQSEDARSTKLLQFDIPTLQPGDEMAVWAENPAPVVEEFAAKLGITTEELDDMFLLQRTVATGSGDDQQLGFDRFPLPNSFRTILTMYVGLTEPIQHSVLSALAPLAPHCSKLQDLASNYNISSAWTGSVLPRWMDIFDLFLALVHSIPLAVFFSLAPLMRPRHYSISSCPAVNPGKVALCVGRHTYSTVNGQQRSGFCSLFLTSLIPGQKVRFKLISQPTFRVPINSTSPMIMVAAGTGIAPFRGFWQERLLRLEQNQQLGPGILVFGCRTFNEYLFQTEVHIMIEKGAITDVLTAFSREKDLPTRYVQDLIMQQEAILKPLLLNPRCHVFVCGSGSMAKGVSRAIKTVMGQKQYEAMVEHSRYNENVFGQHRPDADCSNCSSSSKVT